MPRTFNINKIWTFVFQNLCSNECILFQASVDGINYSTRYDPYSFRRDHSHYPLLFVGSHYTVSPSKTAEIFYFLKKIMLYKSPFKNLSKS